MRILYVVDKYPSVSETFVSDQIRILMDRGHDVRVISTLSGDRELPVEMSGRAVSLGNLMHRSWWARLMSVAPMVGRLLTQESGIRAMTLFSPRYRLTAVKLRLASLALYCQNLFWDWIPDLVVSHFGYNGLHVNALRRAGILPDSVPSVTFFHAYEISGKTPKQIRKRFGRMFEPREVLLPISKLWREKLLAAGALPENTRVMHMGIDPQRFSWAYKPRIPGTLNILSVGRLVEKKGYVYAVEAIHRLQQDSGLKVHYTIVGDGPQMEMLRAYQMQLGPELIELKGAQNHAEVQRLLAETDVMLLASCTAHDGDMEGIPVSLMEAMARGKICISTIHSGIPELISDGDTGLLATEKDANALVDKFKQYLSMNAGQVEAMAIRARNKVVAEFDQTELTTRLEQFGKMPKNR